MSDELILAISGNDIFSGGGLHADLATFTTNKQHGNDSKGYALVF